MKKDNLAKTGDLHDSKKDQEKLKPETITIDMPEVKDIPGQENIKVPQFREMQDVTISSAGEEGDGLLDDLNADTEQLTDDAADVTPQEISLLKKSEGHQPTAETADFNEMALDDRDAEGVLLNEKGIKQDRSGEDLDTPGADLDDDDENIGEEDEENNVYSQRD
ncbi:MAG: hypothetical protein ABIU63_18580 [Chitinophagaceae bacterium]